MIITGIGSSKRSKEIGDNISRIFHKKTRKEGIQNGEGPAVGKKENNKINNVK